MDNPYAAPGQGPVDRGNNPYGAPSLDITEVDIHEPYAPSMFSLEGRIGRWRFLGYSFAYLFLMGMVLGALEIAGVVPPKFGPNGDLVLGLLCYVPLTLTGRRRLHDLDHSGWWLLMFIVPFLNLIIGLYLTFGRGTEGANRFGPPPEKNHPGIYLLFLLPFIGIMAAIAIPAYQHYAHASISGRP